MQILVAADIEGGATGIALAELFATLPIVRSVDALTVAFTSPMNRHAIRVRNSLSAMPFMLR
ncbi:MAG TPA: hypothetical protein VKT00_03780 [Casimicrobiaceae bacterium]|nr:hypothetical protein [Casimicrobiaceae bacterium]